MEDTEQSDEFDPDRVLMLIRKTKSETEELFLDFYCDAYEELCKYDEKSLSIYFKSHLHSLFCRLIVYLLYCKIIFFHIMTLLFTFRVIMV